MIMNYIVERLSWIMLFIFMQLLTLFVGLVDPSISLRPLLYIIFLSTLSFIIFVLVRYHKESVFYKSLEARDSDDDFAELKRPTSPLERIVAEQLTEQLRAYQMKISQQSTALELEKDELLSWIHEVKTPLTAMHLVIDRVENKEIKQQLSYEWLRIQLLLDQQLHQKRIPFMENDLYIEETKLEPLIFEEIKALRTWCMRKGIGFDISLQVEEVLTDSKWFAFVIRQLLTNAIKYTEHDDIVISSYMERGRKKILFQDNGRGIDAKDIPRIFNRGFTSTTVHHDTASTGMGLYLVKSIANSLQIKIDVQSKVGEGTTFTITFPQKNELVSITGM